MPFPFTERADVASPCFCVGPQRGEPVCPCAMRTVQIINGRYVKPAVDLGPAPPYEADIDLGHFREWRDCKFTYTKESSNER